MKTALGFGLLFGCLGLSVLVGRLRRSGQPVLRAVAGRVHWGVGVVALGCLALLLVSALQL